MYFVKLPNAAAHKITVTSTATLLFDLIATAASEAHGLNNAVNAIAMSVEDGDIRVTFDGTDPTSTAGLLISSGARTIFSGVPLSKMKLIRVTGDVAVSLEIGYTEKGEATVMSGSGGGSSSGAEVKVDDAAFTPGTSSVGVVGFIADETATDSVDEGDAGAARMTLDRKQITASEHKDDVAATLGGYGSAIMGMADETSTDLVDEGDLGYLRMSLRRAMKTDMDTLIAGENQDTNRMMVEHQYNYQAVVTADTQVKAAPGFIHTVTISCNDAAPTAGSIIIYDNTAESGTVLFNHTFTTTPFVPFTVVLDMVCNTGIYVGFTTTADVNLSLSYR